jgi:hypothetical protein
VSACSNCDCVVIVPAICDAFSVSVESGGGAGGGGVGGAAGGGTTPSGGLGATSVIGGIELI